MSTVLDFRKRAAKGNAPSSPQPNLIDSLRALDRSSTTKRTPNFNFVFIDTLMVSQPTSMGLHHTPMLMAVGLNEGGEHSLLGAAMITGSLSESWQRLMDHMRLGGLRDVKLVVSSAPDDLKMATLRAFPRAQWQRPAGVLHSRLMEKVPAPHRRNLRAYLSAMYTRNELLEAEIVAAKILSTLTRLGLWDAAIEFSATYPDTLTCFTLPKPMRRQVFDDKALGALIDSFIQSATQSGQFRGCNISRLRFDELITESELHSPATTLPGGAADPDKTVFESVERDMPKVLEDTHAPIATTAVPEPTSALPDLLETTASPAIRRIAPKSVAAKPEPAPVASKPLGAPKIESSAAALANKPLAPSTELRLDRAAPAAPVATTHAVAESLRAKPAEESQPPFIPSSMPAADASPTERSTLEKLGSKIAAQALSAAAKHKAVAPQPTVVESAPTVRKKSEATAVNNAPARVIKPTAPHAPLVAKSASQIVVAETPKVETNPAIAAPASPKVDVKPASATPPPSTPKQAPVESNSPAALSANREVTIISHCALQPPALTSMLDLGGAIDLDSNNVAATGARDFDLPPLEDLQPFGTPWNDDGIDELDDLEEPDFPDEPTLLPTAKEIENVETDLELEEQDYCDEATLLPPAKGKISFESDLQLEEPDFLDEPTLLPPAKEKISFETRLELEALENFVKASELEREQVETPAIASTVAETSTPSAENESLENIENAIAVEIIEMPLPAGLVFPVDNDPITIPVPPPQQHRTKPTLKQQVKGSRWRYAGASAAAIAINTFLFGLAVALLAPHGREQLQASMSQFVHFIDAPTDEATRAPALASSHNAAAAGSNSETDAMAGISENNRKLVSGGDAQPPTLAVAAPELPIPNVKLTRIPQAGTAPARNEHAEEKAAPDVAVTKPLAKPTDNPGAPAASTSPAAPAAGEGDGMGTGNGSGSASARASRPAAAPTIEVNVQPQFRQPPAYPPKALMDGIEGEVTLEFNILEDGTVRDARVVEAVPAGVFDTAALSAIALWRYAPKEVDGQRVARRARQSMLFTLRH